MFPSSASRYLGPHHCESAFAYRQSALTHGPPTSSAVLASLGDWQKTASPGKQVRKRDQPGSLPAHITEIGDKITRAEHVACAKRERNSGLMASVKRVSNEGSVTCKNSRFSPSQLRQCQKGSDPTASGARPRSRLRTRLRRAKEIRSSFG
jgi:hypothetical protein